MSGNGRPSALDISLSGRFVALDTETTGLDPKNDRVIEIGGVELIDGKITGRTYHTYINPDRAVPREAFQVHGLSRQFLLNFPRFQEVASGFVDFLGDARLVIHNAPFDVGFLDEELARIGRPGIAHERVHDTIPMVKEKFPGTQVNLSRVARRYGVSTEGRTLHGGLIDAQILAQVFACLAGADPRDLFGISAVKSGDAQQGSATTGPVAADGRVDGPAGAPAKTGAAGIRPARVFKFDPAETEAHRNHVRSEIKNPLWDKVADGKKPESDAGGTPGP